MVVVEAGPSRWKVFAAALTLLVALSEPEAGRAAPTPRNPQPRPASPASPSKPRFTCGPKYYCRDMNSCAEANFYLKTCGLKKLDGDNDGVPCESLCGGG